MFKNIINYIKYVFHKFKVRNIVYKVYQTPTYRQYYTKTEKFGIDQTQILGSNFDIHEHKTSHDYYLYIRDINESRDKIVLQNSKINLNEIKISNTYAYDKEFTLPYHMIPDLIHALYMMQEEYSNNSRRVNHE